MRRFAFEIVLAALLAGATTSVSQAQSDKPAGNDRVDGQQAPPAQERVPKSGGSIRGRVIGEGGRAVADAPIMAFPVNVASNMVFNGSPGMLHYVVSKGAVVAFSRVLARELGSSNIRVNTLAPGSTQSDENPSR